MLQAMVNLHLKYPNPWTANKKQAWIHSGSQARPRWVFMLNIQLCISGQKSLRVSSHTRQG